MKYDIAYQWRLVMAGKGSPPGGGIIVHMRRDYTITMDNGA